MKVAALAGGVGGAKLADGLAQILAPEDLTIIVNVGDDFDHFGLRICPDLDTVCYTLAGLANPVTGWGRVDESWQVFDTLSSLGAPSWFRLGDRDLATHLERSRRLVNGEPLSAVVSAFCKAWGVGPLVLPVSDDPIPTIVETDIGDLPFQDYFVRMKCSPMVKGFRFQGIREANPGPGVTDSLREADLIVICPSNPWVSVDPILGVPGLEGAIVGRKVVAVSPIIGGETVKGPAAKMYRELGIAPSAYAVARHYAPRLSGFVLDKIDKGQTADIQGLGQQTFITNSVMVNAGDRKRLAEEVLTFSGNIR